MNRLHNRIEPFPALFWALSIVLVHTYTAISDPAHRLASLNCGTGTVLYGRQSWVRVPELHLRLCTFFKWPRVFVHVS